MRNAIRVGRIYLTTLYDMSFKMKKIVRAVDAMFVWTPDTELYGPRTYPLRGKVNVTAFPESAYSWQHPRSAGARNSGWEKVGIRLRLARGLVTAMIHEDNITEDEVRRA